VCRARAASSADGRGADERACGPAPADLRPAPYVWSGAGTPTNAVLAGTSGWVLRGAVPVRRRVVRPRTAADADPAGLPVVRPAGPALSPAAQPAAHPAGR
jgi:hypothetical protein